MSKPANSRNDTSVTQIYENLLSVSEAISSFSNLSDLFKGLAAQLRPIVEFDAVSVVLYDAERDVMRLHLFESGQQQSEAPPTDDVGRAEESPVGIVWQTQKPMLISPVRNETGSSNYFERIRAAGINTLYSIPLTSSGRRLGAIAFGSTRENAYDEAATEFFRQVAKQVAIAVDNVSNLEAAANERDRKQLLLEVGEAVVSNLSLRDLFRAISKCLKRYIGHDTASVVLMDQETGELRVHMLEEAHIKGLLHEGMVIPRDGTPAGLCIKTRSTILRETIDFEEFYVPQMRLAYAAGLRCGCSVLLSSNDQVLGALNVGSFHEAAFTRADAELLEQIADPVAVAVQNSLNFERAERERDRNQLLLEINNTVVTNLGLKDLLKAVSTCLRGYFKHEFAGMSLYDEVNDEMVVHSLDTSQADKYLVEGSRFPIEGSLNGLAFKTLKPVVRNRVDTNESSWPLIKEFFEQHGLRSYCCIPMIAGGKAIGVLNVGSKHENAFSQADVELLVHISGQISIAVENSLNFDRATKAKERAQILLEANNAISASLDLRDLVKATSACLRRYFNHDVTGLALYDPTRNRLLVHAADRNDNSQFGGEGSVHPMEGTPVAEAFTTGKPVLGWRVDFEKYPAPEMRAAYEAGWRSGACIPLIVRDRTLGVLGLVSLREDGFNDIDGNLLVSIAGQVALSVENTLQFREIESLKNKLASEKLYLEEEIKTQYNFAEIVGQSKALSEILQQVGTVAPTDSTVLLRGETGTGKELIARAIHDLSQRKERTLVKLNCAAIPTGLLESELFGHEKGAFTGAIAPRVGRFELANQGTLLLDEIGEIPLELQPKLLRVLQEHEFERLGSSRTIKTNARLIAATNCDLAQMVAEKKFRSDLFYRLNVFPIVIPPLRERTGDIPLLITYFAEKHGARMNKPIRTIPTRTMEALCAYDWPGNVRELENFIERSVILSRGSELEAPLAELHTAARTPETSEAAREQPKLTTLDEMERSYIEEVLRHSNGAIAGKGGAAEILGLPSSTLRSRMKKLGIK